uniref:DNA-directed RNA polymerases I and III subunit RPAC2 n=1 Tax=Leersia perrieri TaxID=77586 RepID=A0A0D9XQE6_9ORYZ
MEHGSLEDSSASTFSIAEEDHTLANSVRFVLNQDPRVAFCGYSIPHPADNKVNIRVQTTGDPAKDVFKDALQDLIVMCQHVRGTFDNAVVDHRSNISAQQMDIDSNSQGCGTISKRLYQMLTSAPHSIDKTN